MRQRGGLLLRVGFVAVLGGGLLLWAHLRKPRDLAVELDLTRALPGELVEVDLIVRRGGKLLERSDQRYGPRGAPALVRTTIHAAPGTAEVEATLVRGDRSASRVLVQVDLAEGRPARVIGR